MQKKEHFSSQCFTANVREVTSSGEVTSSREEDLDLAFLCAVVTADEISWIADISVNGESMKFKVDTGAEVTAVTELALTQLGNVQLHPATKTLCGPDKKPLKVLGQISATLCHSGKNNGSCMMTTVGKCSLTQSGISCLVDLAPTSTSRYIDPLLL